MCTMPHGLKGHSEALTQRTVWELLRAVRWLPQWGDDGQFYCVDWLELCLIWLCGFVSLIASGMINWCVSFWGAMPYSAVAVALLLAAFVRVFCGQLLPSVALSWLRFRVVFWVYSERLCQVVNGRYCPTLLALFLCGVMRECPTFLAINTICCCKK